MKKIFKDNLKKITALLLVISMAMSFDLSAFAQDAIVQEDIIQDKSIIVEDIQNDDPELEVNNELIEEDILLEASADGNGEGASDSKPVSDEEAREIECISDYNGKTNPDYLKKFLTYLSLKYPDIGIDPKYGTGINPSITGDSELRNWYNAAKMGRQTKYETIEINGEDKFEECPDLTKNMVQFRYMGNFDGSIGGTAGTNETVKTLIIRNVDEIRNLYVPEFVETLIIENTTINCYETPGFQCGSYGDLMNCKNLKKLVIKNIKFGDNYKDPDHEVGTWGKYGYEKKYRINLQNCPNLEELVIDVSFDGAEDVTLAINGGDNNLFKELKAEKFSINPPPGTGLGQVTLYANENSKLSEYYNTTKAVEFKSELFKRWLIDPDGGGADRNRDGVVSQGELLAIKSLTINANTAKNVAQTSLDDFKELPDIAQMGGLTELELDFGDEDSSGNEIRRTLKNISFPISIKKLTMKNIHWSSDKETKEDNSADITLKDLEELVLINTKVDPESFDHPTQIVLTDTEGVLQSCIIEKADVESIELVNNSNKNGVKDDDEKQRIRFSASECENLESVEFLGEGYAVEGSLDLTNDINLTHIGVPNSDGTQWTVYGEFDMTGKPVNVTLNGCKSLGTDCNEIVIDYDFVSGLDLNVQSMSTVFSDSNALTIIPAPTKEGEKASIVYLSCDSTGSNVWVYNHYTKALADGSRKEIDGFKIEDRTSFPTIAAFTNCQRVHSDGDCGAQNATYTDDTNSWVERWDLVMQPGGYSANFGELKFYVIDDLDGTKSLRKVFYEGDVYVEWDKQNTADSIITLPTTKDDEKGGYILTGTKLSSTGIPGEVQLKLYVYDGDDKSYIGYQDIKIFKLPDSVELVNDGTERGSGTKDDPFIVDKDEELKLKARLLLSKEDEKTVVDTAGEWALRDIYWRIKEYDEISKYTSDSDGYSLYTLDSATKAGISVVRGDDYIEGETDASQYDRRKDDSTYYNHRRFSFDTDGAKYKIVAQMPYKNNDAVITKEVFVEYHSEPLSIDISNDIIHGKKGYDEATITIDSVYNINSVNVSIKNPELYDDCFIVGRDNSGLNGEDIWKDIWKLKINNSDNAKVKNKINSSGGSIILVINADGKTYEERINLSSIYSDASVDISNDIIHGKNGCEEATITITDVHNINTIDVSIKNSELYDDCFAVKRDPASSEGKELWKLWISNSDITKVKNIINSNNGSITLVINVDGKKYEKTVNLSSVYHDTGKFWYSEIEDQIYTGKAIEPKLNIYYGAIHLVEGKDYTLSYSNNVKVASKDDVNSSGKHIGPSVTINGKGNYSDKQTYYFTIKPSSIENADRVDDIFVAKTNRDIKITPTVILDGKKLKQGSDYVVSTTTNEKDAVVSFKEPKEYPLYVVGKGNYTGAIPFKFTITEKTLASKVTIKKITDQKYAGNALTPSLEVTYKIGGNVTDVADNFTVEYKNNTEIGTAKVIITAKPESELFAGSKSVTFKITGEQIKNAKLGETGKGTIVAKVYDGNPYEPDESKGLILYYGNELAPLVKGQDYTVSYTNNKNAGTATALVTGKGKYTGTKKLTYKIIKYDAGTDSASIISVDGGKDIVVSYEKGGVTPKPTISMNGVTLTEKKDYTIKYANNKAVAKADAVNARGKSVAPTMVITFRGNLSGKKSVNFEITNKDISGCKITKADKAHSTKVNAWKQTAVTIVDTNGKKLKAGTDYSKTLKYYSDLSCTNEITAETLDTNTIVYVKVDGINNYDKSIVGSYRISKNNISKVNASIDPQTFTGNEICPAANEIKVWTGSGSNKTDLVAGQDYDILPDSYTNNVNKGTATVTIVGKGDYFGTKVVKYRICVNKILW